MCEVCEVEFLSYVDLIELRDAVDRRLQEIERENAEEAAK
jgi:hypothetical protein